MTKPNTGSEKRQVVSTVIGKLSAWRRSLPLAVGISCSIGTILLWQALATQQQQYIIDQIHSEAQGAQKALSIQIKDRTLMLVRLAQEWEQWGKQRQEDWEFTVRLNASQYPSYQAIAWIDPSLQMRSLVPLSGDRASQDLEQALEVQQRLILATAYKQGEVRVTPAFDLTTGGKGILVYRPVFQGKDFYGFIVALVRVQTMFDGIQEKMITPGLGYKIAVFQGGAELYHSLGATSEPQAAWVQQQIKLNSITWQIRVWPTASYLAHLQSPLPTIVLGAGIGMAWLLALTIYWIQKAQLHAQKISFVNQALQHQIASRQQAEKALRESEARYRQLVEFCPETIFLQSEDKFVFVNDAGVKLFGAANAEQLIGKSILDFVHPDYWESMRERHRKLREESQKSPLLEEYRVVRFDGSVRWIGDRAFPIRDASGQVYRIVGIAQDITQRKQAEVAIRKALEAERELNQVRSRFFSMATHEFRNPLTAISGFVQLLRIHGDVLPAEKKQRYFHLIFTSVSKMTQLLEDVLLIGRAEAGKLEDHSIHLDLEKFCLDLVEEMQLTAGQQHTLTFVKRGLCNHACLDEKLLRHIFTNLLSNAIKYSSLGSPIEFELACQDGQAVFQIQDRGIGIPLEEQKFLFEAFHRAENVGDIPGTGLGLVIVKQCVDLCQGKIEVVSEVGVGTTVTVSLPINPLMKCQNIEPQDSKSEQFQLT